MEKYSDDFAWSVATLAIMAATKNTKAGKGTVIDIDAGIAAVKGFLNKLDKQQDDLCKEITRLQEKYDENGYDCSPLIKLQRIEQHVDMAIDNYKKLID